MTLIKISSVVILGDSWYFRLVSSLHRSIWHENQFVHLVNLLCENQSEIKYFAIKALHLSLHLHTTKEYHTTNNNIDQLHTGLIQFKLKMQSVFCTCKSSIKFLQGIVLQSRVPHNLFAFILHFIEIPISRTVKFIFLTKYILFGHSLLFS